MKICILTKNLAEINLLLAIEKKVRENYPNFSWECYNAEDKKGFLDFLKLTSVGGVFSIVATGNKKLLLCAGVKEFDLIWPLPSTFLKDKALKNQVWEDIQNKVIPILSQETSINLSNIDITSILELLAVSKKPFHFQSADGSTIGVNSTKDYDICLSSADLASMLVAQVLFDAERIYIE